MTLSTTDTNLDFVFVKNTFVLTEPKIKVEGPFLPNEIMTSDREGSKLI